MVTCWIIPLPYGAGRLYLVFLFQSNRALRKFSFARLFVVVVMFMLMSAKWFIELDSSGYSNLEKLETQSVRHQRQ